MTDQPTLTRELEEEILARWPGETGEKIIRDLEWIPSWRKWWWMLDGEHYSIDPKGRII